MKLEAKANLNNQILKWLHETENATAEVAYRSISSEDYKFYAGAQDSETVLQELSRQKRPSTVYNEIMPKINMVIGMAAQNKFQPEIIPVGTEDAPLAELMQMFMLHKRNKLKLARKELEAFTHTVKGGRSLLYFYVDDINPFKPEVKVKRIPGHNFYRDPNSEDLTLEEDRFLFIDFWKTESELKILAPKLDPAVIKNFDRSVANMPTFFEPTDELFRVVECWYRWHEKCVWFTSPLTQKQECLTVPEFKKLKAGLAEGMQVGEQPVQYDGDYGEREAYRSIVRHVTFSGDYEVTPDAKSPLLLDELGGFPAVFYGAYHDDDLNNWYGLITMMKDPQRTLNTLRRQLVHLLQTLPKGILIHEAGAVLNIDEYERDSMMPGFHLEVAKGGVQKVHFLTQPQISPLYQQFDGLLSQGMKNASGIQDAMMGLTASREPGVTLRNKQETGLAVLFSLFDNYKESRIKGSNILLKLLQQYSTTPDVIRVTGQKGMELVQINSQMNPEVKGFNDVTAGEFDVVIDETLYTNTMRQYITELLTDVVRNNPGSIPMEIILEYAGLPFSVRQRVTEWQQQQQQMQMEMQARELAQKGAKK